MNEYYEEFDRPKQQQASPKRRKGGAVALAITCVLVGCILGVGVMGLRKTATTPAANTTTLVEGLREKSVYGAKTFDALMALCHEEAQKLGVELRCVQSNHEGALIDAIQQAYFDRVDGMIINPAAYTHTSVALLDAVKAVGIPTVEVHVSDPDSREDFRHVSYIRAACIATIRGHGLPGYLEALRLLCERGEGRG